MLWFCNIVSDFKTINESITFAYQYTQFLPSSISATYTQFLPSAISATVVSTYAIFVNI